MSDKDQLHLVSLNAIDEGGLLRHGQNSIEPDLDNEDIHSSQNEIQPTIWQELQGRRHPTNERKLELRVIENSRVRNESEEANVVLH